MYTQKFPDGFSYIDYKDIVYFEYTQPNEELNRPAQFVVRTKSGHSLFYVGIRAVIMSEWITQRYGFDTSRRQFQ